MIYILFVGFGLCLLFTPQNALLDETLKSKEVIESDDDKLNQALILVDILKTEYVKLLRQNIQLRNGDESVIDEVEQSTCAANATEAPGVIPGATNETNGNQTAEFSTDGSAPLSAASPPAPAQTSPRGPSMTTPPAMAYYDMPVPAQPPFPLHQKQLQAPHRYLRRRIPDYYYYDLPRRRFFNEPPVVGLQKEKIAPYYRKTIPRGSDFRRFDYDNDPFNDTPTTVLTTPTTASTTTTTTAAPTTAASTTEATTPTTNAQGASNATTMATTTEAPPVETSLATITNPPTTPATRKATTTATTITRRRSVRTTVSTMASTISTENIESLKRKAHHTPSLLTTKDPVDAEVASELVNELKEEGIPLKKIKVKTSRNPTTDIFDPAFKTSMRIYLEKSTRYPIPLPENHAFCYTNPNNPLCRTLIR